MTLLMLDTTYKVENRAEAIRLIADYCKENGFAYKQLPGFSNSYEIVDYNADCLGNPCVRVIDIAEITD